MAMVDVEMDCRVLTSGKASPFSSFGIVFRSMGMVDVEMDSRVVEWMSTKPFYSGASPDLCKDASFQILEGEWMAPTLPVHKFSVAQFFFLLFVSTCTIPSRKNHLGSPFVYCYLFSVSSRVPYPKNSWMFLNWM
jgi:hypothetical protein